MEVSDIPNLRERYEAGESVKKLADERGIARSVIRRWLVELGATIRGQSEAEALKWRQMRRDPDRVRKQVEAAHEAVRGRSVPMAERAMRARTRERLEQHVGMYERELAHALRERGVESATVQRQVGPYNLDVAMDRERIAVEIVNGGGTQGRARRLKRSKYVLDRGWCLVHLYLAGRTPDISLVADKLVALANRPGGPESLRGCHGVIGRDGEPKASGRFYFDGRPVIPGFEAARDTSPYARPRE